MPNHVHIVKPHPFACQSAGNLGPLRSTSQEVEDVQNHHPGHGTRPPHLKQEISSEHCSVYWTILKQTSSFGSILFKILCSWKIKFLISHFETFQLLCFWDNRWSLWSPSHWCKFAVTQLRSLEIYFFSRNKYLINILVTQTAVSLGKPFQLFIIEQPTAEHLKHSYVLWFMSVDTIPHLGGIRLSTEGSLMEKGKRHSLFLNWIAFSCEFLHLWKAKYSIEGPWNWFSTSPNMKHPMK